MYRLCIVGLGNPGKKYDGTRHNIGKDWLIKISNQFFKKFNTKTKFEAEIGESHDNQLLWSIPTNYMNDSGKTIFKILKSTNLKSDMLLIIHDDLDLKLGELRIKKGGGHGGHNGLRDIINKTGQDNFMRLRIGISHPGNKNDVTNWVLTKFSPDEKKLISSSYSKFEEIIELICNNKIEEAQKILHTR